MLPLTGYADRFSVAPGQTIAFKVSSTAATPYQARLVRVISGDPNPAGPGIKEEPVPAPFAASYPSRVQPVPLGSYIRVPDAPALRAAPELHARGDDLADPARPGAARASSPATTRHAGTGFALFVDARGAGALVGNGRGGVHTVHVGKPFLARAWYRVWASYDAATRTLTVGQAPLAPRVRADDAGVAAGGRRRRARARQRRARSWSPRSAARRWPATTTGRSSGPAVYDAALEQAKLAGEPDGASGRHLVALWDFAPGHVQHPRGRRGTERARRRAGEPPGARHDGLELDGRARCAGATRRTSTAPSTSTTTTSTTAGGRPISPTRCRRGSGAASTPCGSRRATSRT